MSYDILLTADRDLPENSQHVRGLEIVAQRVETRLRTFLGGWILDRTAGLPILEWAQQKPPQVPVIGALVRREIETTPGVRQVLNFLSTFTAESRTLAFSGDVVIEDEADPVRITVALLGDEVNTSPGIYFLTATGPLVRGF